MYPLNSSKVVLGREITHKSLTCRDPKYSAGTHDKVPNLNQCQTTANAHWKHMLPSIKSAAIRGVRHTPGGSPGGCAWVCQYLCISWTKKPTHQNWLVKLLQISGLIALDSSLYVCVFILFPPFAHSRLGIYFTIECKCWLRLALLCCGFFFFCFVLDA